MGALTAQTFTDFDFVGRAMAKLVSQSSTVHKAVSDAKRAVDREVPFSPAWDAAMAVLEDAERARWALERRTADGYLAVTSPRDAGDQPTG